MPQPVITTQNPSDINSIGCDFDDKLGRELIAKSLKPVSADLEYLDKTILDFIPHETETAKSVLEHVFDGGGKRIRPALFFLCCRLFSYRGDQLYPISAVCEFVHTASLLHDDVIDNSTLRRNKPSANSVWGDQASVLVGDLIYARASELMAATGSIDIVSTFARAIRLMSEGELYQLESTCDLRKANEHYFRTIYCKTAALIAASCKSAAILANAPANQIEALEKFGESLGTAFQLVDDALDYIGSREVFGKSTLSDLKEGKITYPVFSLVDCVDKTELAKLKEILAKQTASSDDVLYVKSLVDRHDTATKTLQLATQFTDKALGYLSLFPKSTAQHDLKTLAHRLVRRFN